jgi:hypothetical protein
MDRSVKLETYARDRNDVQKIDDIYEMSDDKEKISGDIGRREPPRLIDRIAVKDLAHKVKNGHKKHRNLKGKKRPVFLPFGHVFENCGKKYYRYDH